MTWYNEFDPKAAEWLRTLVFFGELSYGQVDGQDIRNIRNATRVNTMIVIEDIKYFKTDEAAVELTSFNMEFLPIEWPDGSRGFKRLEAVRELTRLMIVRRSDGEKIGLGVSEKVGEVLQLHYDAHDQALQDIKYLSTQNRLLQDKERRIHAIFKTAGLWQRVKWVFTGYKPVFEESGARHPSSTPLFEKSIPRPPSRD